MAGYDESPGGYRAYRQRRGGDQSPLSLDDWTLIEQVDDSMSPHRPAADAAAAYLHETRQQSDVEDVVGTTSASSAAQRRRRRRLRQKQQQEEDFRDSSDSEPPPSSSTYTPRTSLARAATSTVSMHMRMRNPPPPPAPSPGLMRSATVPHHRWARSHVYEEDVDNSNSRSNSRRSGSRPDRSMAGSRPSSRTSVSDEEDEGGDTDGTTSTPDNKGKLVQSRSRNPVPPPAPPPPRVPAPPTRRGKVAYEEEEEEDEDMDAMRKRDRSRGPVRDAVRYEDDQQRRRRRDKSRTPRRDRNESVYDDVVDLRRVKERVRSRSRPARAKSIYEEDIDLDEDEHIRSESRARRTDVDLDVDRMKERLRSRSRPRPAEEEDDESLEMDKQVRAKPSRRDLIYEEDREVEYGRSRSRPRQPEMVYEEDEDSNRRSKSRVRRAETVYEVDMQDVEPVGAPEPPRRSRHGEIAYMEESEMMADARNPFVERARSRSRPAPARTEKHHKPEKGPRRKPNIDEARSPSHSRSNRLTGRHYESEVAYRGSRAPSLRKSQTTVGSREASSQSVGSSGRRSASLLGQFFGPALLPPGQDRPVKLVPCVICMEEVPSHRSAKLKCDHRMCNSCLKNVFKMSVKDPQLMPPKCCTADHIPLKHVDRLFDTNFKKTWNRKHAEFTTLNRIYCPSRRCGEWIKPENVRRDADGRKVAQCGQCRTKVCVKCNGKWHKERQCPRDDDTREFLQQAKEAGWQRCHRCKAMVELKEGCNHMTCRCGAQFCMICGSKWKSCDCPWFNHEAVDSDTLDDMQIPMTLHQEPSIRSIRYRSRPPSPSDLRSHSDMMTPVARVRPQNFDDQILIRKLHEQQDDIHARRIRTTDRYDDHDRRYYNEYPGDYRGPREQMTHDSRDEYLRRPETVLVPPPPHTAPLGAQYAPYDRAVPGLPGMDYITGVHRARGMQTGSMERRRLADRFSTDPRHTPTRTPTHAPPPPRLNKSATMPVLPMPMPMSLPMPMPMPMHMGMPPPPIGMMGVHPGHQHHGSAPAGLGMPPLLRRNTMEDELYSTRSPPRRPEPGMRQHRREEDLDEDDAPMASTPPRHHRRRNTQQEEAEASAMAGLSGAGRGMDRVHEWAAYVEPGEPVEEKKGPLSVSTGSTVSVRS